MAIFLPTLEQIKRLKVKPTQGEWALLVFLDSVLNDTYEIFFQPYVNGDNPDIIILREGSGVMIIEVKDWDLDCYEICENTNWQLKNIKNIQGAKQYVKSPIQQVFEYKENLYNLHIESLLEKRIKNPKYLSVVTCAVYFHKTTKNALHNFLTNGFEKKSAYLKFLSHFELFGFDSLTQESFNQILSKRWLDKQSFLFDKSLYKSFKRYLQPPTHTKEQGKTINYTEDQLKIIVSKSGVQQKVKGVAGSGKTLALAKRAVNAHLRHKGDVLILTFNISLRNYIHDKLSEIREDYSWKYFTILHYHQFVKSCFNNENVLQTEQDFSKIVVSKKFETIIVDEIQDYSKEWIYLIKRFLSEDGEFVVFGDEKQNIYQRSLEDKKPFTSIGGQWNLLKKSFRITVDIANLAVRFQKAFFIDKYEHDDILVQRDLFDISLIKYFYLEQFDLISVMSIYKSIIESTDVHDNDVCFQASKVEVLRVIDKYIRSDLHKKTNTMFETIEVYDKLKLDSTINNILDEEKFKKQIEIVRRYKKFNFWMNSGTTKLSTIHSFKGWEIHTLFLIIETEGQTDSRDFTTDELVYTAITRCRQNLIIINIGNKRYDAFFKPIF